MGEIKSIRYYLFTWVVGCCLILSACSDVAVNRIAASKTKDSSLRENTKPKQSILNDSLALIYSLAISDFIQAVYEKEHQRFDTLFFGKHAYGQEDDFPPIVLPDSIHHTVLRLVAPDFVQQAALTDKPKVFINMMGWVNKTNAEFTLVVFNHGAHHQYDCFLNYDYQASTQKYILTNLAFEDYRTLTSGKKPERIPFYPKLK